MNKEEIREKFMIEAEIQSRFNESEHLHAHKAELVVGRDSKNEFDIYEAGGHHRQTD